MREMDGQSNGPPIRLPLSSIENVISRRAIGIPKMKLKKVLPTENIAISTFDALHNLVEEFIHDRAAAALAFKYISKLRSETSILRDKLCAFEESAPLFISGNEKEVVFSSSTAKCPKSMESVQQLEKPCMSSISKDSITSTELMTPQLSVDLNSCGGKTHLISSDCGSTLIRPDMRDDSNFKLDVLHDTIAAAELPIVRRSSRRMSLSASSVPIIPKRAKTTRAKGCRQTEPHNGNQGDTYRPQLESNAHQAMAKSNSKSTSSKLVSSPLSPHTTTIDGEDACPMDVSSDEPEIISRIRSLSMVDVQDSALVLNSTKTVFETVGSCGNQLVDNNYENFCSANDQDDDDESYGLLMFDSVPLEWCLPENIDSVKGPLHPQSSPDALHKCTSMDTIIDTGKVDLVIDKKKGAKTKYAETQSAGRRMSARFRAKPGRFLSEESDEVVKAVSQRVVCSVRKETVPRNVTPRRQRVVEAYALCPSSKIENLQMNECDATADYEQKMDYTDADTDDYSMVMKMDDYQVHVPSTESSVFRPIIDSTPLDTPSKYIDQHEEENSNYYDDDALEDQALLRWCDNKDFYKAIAVDTTDFTCVPMIGIGEGRSDHNEKPIAEYLNLRTSLSVITAAAVRHQTNDIAISATPLAVSYFQSNLIGADPRDAPGAFEFQGLLTSSILPVPLQNAFEVIASCQEAPVMKSSAAGAGYMTALLSLLTAAGRTSSLLIPPEFMITFSRSMAALTECMDSPEDQTRDQPNSAETKSSCTANCSNKKSVRFCGVDGSSVVTPGKDCAHEPALYAVRRLHLLISRIDDLIADILSHDEQRGNWLLDTLLNCCQHLMTPLSASAVSSALWSSLSLAATSGELVAIAGMLTSELTAAKSARSAPHTSQSLVGVRTSLRFRTAWMATSVLRAQLRWLLDPPPAHASVPTASGYPISSIRRCNIYKMVTLRDIISVESPNGHKKRRKSDVVAMDHTVVHPLEMSLSSLLTHALRQIYDAFTSAVAGSPSQSTEGHSLDVFVSEFLIAAVTTFDMGEDGGPSLEGLELVQPQVRTDRHTISPKKTGTAPNCLNNVDRTTNFEDFLYYFYYS